VTSFRSVEGGIEWDVIGWRHVLETHGFRMSESKTKHI